MHDAATVVARPAGPIRQRWTKAGRLVRVTQHHSTMLKFVALYGTATNVEAVMILADNWPDAIAKAEGIATMRRVSLLQISRGS